MNNYVMFKRFVLLGFGSISYLVRKTDISPPPNEGESCLFVKGDRTGFWDWRLKISGSEAPSIFLKLHDKLTKRIDGGKVKIKAGLELKKSDFENVFNTIKNVFEKIFSPQII